MVDVSGSMGTLLGAILALFGAIAAYTQRISAKENAAAAAAATQNANDVVGFYDPAISTETSATVVDSLPARSWKMNEETKHWIIFDHPASEQGELLRQIADAEDQKKTDYIITAGDTYYHIQFGLLSGSGKGSSKNVR